MTERPSWVPAEVDVERPSAARIYDYYLGGSHNFAVDRELAELVMKAVPALPLIAKANRAFLRRAVLFCVEQGIRQFIDLGSGIPTVSNVHEVAQQVQPDVRVVYVDNDPIAFAHSKALLDSNEGATVVQADMRKPYTVMVEPELRHMIDLSEPVAVLMVAVLHFVPDSDHPYQAVAGFRDATASGSYLVLTHGCSATDSVECRDYIVKLYSRSATPLALRSYREIGEFFDGYQVVDPGLVPVTQWRPSPAAELELELERLGAQGLGMYAGVGRKP